MMQIFPGYHLKTQLYESPCSLVYRAVRESDKQAVVIKLLNIEYPSQEELARFRRGYSLIRELDAESIISVYSVENYKNSLFIVMEDIGGVSIAGLLSSGAFGIESFLQLAISMAGAIAEIHQLKLIHKDICPQNIIVNPETCQVKIIDFGISSELFLETQEAINPDSLEGTLDYLSPEQTGRMNRMVDYRTDLYALGATFYHMLTGVPPFCGSDAMELVHAHIAKIPSSPSDISSAIPSILSDIVLKLMAKTAEDRYQSGGGLRADLQLCFEQWQKKSEISAFTFATHDFSGQFQIPQKLYGRDKEVSTLMAAFDRVASGSTEMILVAGYSGVGKSVLIQEVHKPIVAKRGYFISGKFDQFLRNIPYSALIQAFRGLAKQLLTESDVQLEAWKNKLLLALGNEAQVIVDIIPEIGLIVGSQIDVPLLGPQETQNRFNMKFLALIQVFARKEHPLVIFLDDLQWADSATLNLLINILADRASQYLLFMGAYRDNEVDRFHPFIVAVEEIKCSGATAHTLELLPLTSNALNLLITDTFNTQRHKVNELGQLVLNKTEGNPFFVCQFLKRLYQDQLISFDFYRTSWQWDVRQIEARGITSNVVELMVEKIEKLPTATQKALNLGACIGNVFELNTLALICEEPLPVLVQHLWPALEQGLLVARGDQYKLLKIMGEKESTEGFDESLNFQHDRIQQAAYEVVAPGERELTHLKIGRVLLENLTQEGVDEQIFAIVGQLNDGRRLVVTVAEKIVLAEYNIKAGKKAKAATAYGPALEYFRIAKDLLPDSLWQDHYALAFELFKALAECEYLEGDLRGAEVIFNEALVNVSSKYDRCDIYVLKLVLFFTQNKYIESIEMGIEALKLFNINISSNPTDDDIQQGILGVKKVQGGRPFSQAKMLPECKDLDTRYAIKILTELGPPTYMANPKLLLVVFSKMVEISYARGVFEDSSYGFGGYCVVLAGVLGEYDAAYDCGIASLEINERFNSSHMEGRVHMLFTAFTNHWKQPIATSFPLLKKGFQDCIRVGELRYACYMHLFSFWQRWANYSTLDQLNEEYTGALHFMEKVKDHDAIAHVSMLLASIKKLQCKTVVGGPDLALSNNTSLNDGVFDEESYKRDVVDTQYVYGLNSYHMMKLMICYTYDDYGQALYHADESENSLEASVALYSLVEHCQYTLLTLAMLACRSSGSKREQYILKMNDRLDQMIVWAKNCPENYYHKLQLMQAEKCRAEGDILECISFYDRAEKSAEQTSFLKDRALIQELYAKFWLQQGKERYAEIHMLEACHLYNQWGAVSKVRQLVLKYPSLLEAFSSPSAHNEKDLDNSVVSSLRGTSSAMLDLDTVIKAAQSISESLVFEELTNDLLKIAIENAGAQKGVLLLKSKNDFFIEAVAELTKAPVEEGISIPIDSAEAELVLPASVVHYVVRTKKDISLDNALEDDRFSGSEYIVKNKLKSVLCVPIIYQGRLSGILYLENNIVECVFSKERRLVLETLASQAAISLENARLYRALYDAKNTLERRVEERTAQLEEANTELNAFSHSVSHDLRAPLRAMKGLSGILLDDYSESIDAEGQLLIERIVHSSEKMTELIDGLLALSHIQHAVLDIKPVSLSQLVKESNAELSECFPDQMCSLVCADDIDVEGDRRMLKSLIENLLSNAWKYTAKIECPQIEFGVGTQNDKKVYFIRDNGAGFNMEYVEKVFVAFQRLHSESEFSGTGIGLATVKRIVNKHGGEIWVDAKVGKGAVFYFTLGLSPG